MKFQNLRDFKKCTGIQNLFTVKKSVQEIKRNCDLKICPHINFFTVLEKMVRKIEMFLALKMVMNLKQCLRIKKMFMVKKTFENAQKMFTVERMSTNFKFFHYFKKFDFTHLKKLMSVISQK